MSNTTKTIVWILVAAATVTLGAVIYSNLTADPPPIIVLRPKKPTSTLSAASDAPAPNVNTAGDLGWFSKKHWYSGLIPYKGQELKNTFPPDAEGKCGLRSDFLDYDVKYFRYKQKLGNDPKTKGDLQKIEIEKDGLSLTIVRNNDRLVWALTRGDNKCGNANWKHADGYLIPKEFDDLIGADGASSVRAWASTANPETDPPMDGVFWVSFKLKKP